MKIIILGAGQVGSSLAETLVNDQHDITLVDTDEYRLNYLQERLDLRTVLGQCSYPDVLREAGADEADMLIAVTNNDECNMVACQVAYSLFNIEKKIARIRSQHYFFRKELFGRDNLPIDVFISPEYLVTNRIQQLIEYPGSLQVLDFGEGAAKLVAIKPYYGGALLGRSIRELYEALPKVKMKVVAIFRSEHSIPISDDTLIEVGDEVFFITTPGDAHYVIAALRRIESPCRRVFVAGGGNLGGTLAKALQKDYQVKLVDHNQDLCKKLAQQLPLVTILNGNVCDSELLLNENIEDTDIFCSLTNDDEVNIIACLQAKKIGAKNVMALITRTAYVDLIEGGQINIAISPQLITIGSILRYIRRGDVYNVYSLRRGAAEAIEIKAHGDYKTSKVIARPIRTIKLPEGTIIGGIIRGGELIIPHADIEILEGDNVIIFVSKKEHFKDVEKLFQVTASFF